MVVGPVPSESAKTAWKIVLLLISGEVETSVKILLGLFPSFTSLTLQPTKVFPLQSIVGEVGNTETLLLSATDVVGLPAVYASPFTFQVTS